MMIDGDGGGDDDDHGGLYFYLVNGPKEDRWTWEGTYCRVMEGFGSFLISRKTNTKRIQTQIQKEIKTKIQKKKEHFVE